MINLPPADFPGLAEGKSGNRLPGIIHISKQIGKIQPNNIRNRPQPLVVCPRPPPGVRPRIAQLPHLLNNPLGFYIPRHRRRTEFPANPHRWNSGGIPTLNFHLPTPVITNRGVERLFVHGFENQCKIFFFQHSAHESITPTRIRTWDPRLRRPMLYPAELWAHTLRNERTRTSDLLLPKQVPWPLGYVPRYGILGSAPPGGQSIAPMNCRILE